MTKNKDYFQITDTPKEKTSDIVAECRKKFPVYFYDEQNCDNDFPPPKKETIRYFKKVVEADEENANKSLKQCEEEGIQAITLRERLLMELQYFNETREHLDIKNTTLCARSRADRVPCVDWRGARLRVLVVWCGVRFAYPGLRVRSAVLPSTEYDQK